MPGFNQILAEIQTAQGNPALGNPFDHVRRKYIGLLAAKTREAHHHLCFPVPPGRTAGS